MRAKAAESALGKLKASARAEIQRLKTIAEGQQRQIAQMRRRLGGADADAADADVATDGTDAADASDAADAGGGSEAGLPKGVAVLQASLHELEAELTELKASQALDARRHREDMAAVRARARQLAEEKEEELSRLRAAVAKGAGEGGTGTGTAAATGGSNSRSSSFASLSGGGLGGGGLGGGGLGGGGLSGGGGLGGASLLLDDESASAASGLASFGEGGGEGGEEARAAALGLAARMQAGRDAESTALRARVLQLETTLASASAEAKRATAEAVEMRRKADRGEAGEVAGYLKDVLFKYLCASEEQQLTIFPLLSKVVQFTPPELEHIRRVKEHARSTTTASGILSSFFLAPATDEQDASFADPAAVSDRQVGGGGGGGGGGADDADARDADEGAGADVLGAAWLLTPAARRNAGAGGPSGVSAAPLLTPFTTTPKAKEDEAGAAAKAAEEVGELKKKVARLKKLLAVANTHIEKLKEEQQLGRS